MNYWGPFRKLLPGTLVLCKCNYIVLSTNVRQSLRTLSCPPSRGASVPQGHGTPQLSVLSQDTNGPKLGNERHAEQHGRSEENNWYLDGTTVLSAENTVNASSNPIGGVETRVFAVWEKGTSWVWLNTSYVTLNCFRIIALDRAPPSKAKSLPDRLYKHFLSMQRVAGFGVTVSMALWSESGPSPCWINLLDQPP